MSSSVKPSGRLRRGRAPRSIAGRRIGRRPRRPSDSRHRRRSSRQARRRRRDADASRRDDESADAGTGDRRAIGRCCAMTRRLRKNRAATRRESGESAKNPSGQGDESGRKACRRGGSTRAATTAQAQHSATSARIEAPAEGGDHDRQRRRDRRAPTPERCPATVTTKRRADGEPGADAPCRIGCNIRFRCPATLQAVRDRAADALRPTRRPRPNAAGSISFARRA